MAKVPTKERIVRAGMLCILISVAVMWGTFRFHSVCTTCGAEQSAIDWQLPLASVTYWRSRSVSETPLSRAVDRNGLAGPHAHTWAFAHGGGNGVSCAIGGGRHIRTDLKCTGAFLDGVTRYRGKDEARQWATRCLKPTPHMSVDAIVEDYPFKGIATRDEFNRWWEQHRMDIEWVLNPPASEMSAGMP